MKFVLNKDINRALIKEPEMDILGDEKPKKEHQETVLKENPISTEKPKEEKEKKTNDENDLIPLFAVSGITTYLITKYII